MLKNIIFIVSGIIIGIGSFYFLSPDHDHQAENISQNEEQLYTCGMHPEVLLNEPGNCPICEMKLIPVKSKTSDMAGEKKILYWQAPMDPTEIYDQPGKSKMGMDLVAVYEDNAGSGSGIIEIDGRIKQNMNLRTEEAIKRSIKRSIRAYGRVTVAEDFQYTVNTKIKGWIEKLYFNTTGQYVKKGQALLEIYSPELVSTQEEFLLAHNNLQQMSKTKGVAAENARSLYESAKRRLELWDIPEQEINRLIETGQVKRTTTLRSPVNGYLMHKAVVEGDEVGKIPHLFMIADLSKVWVEATVYENDFPFLSLGQTALLNLDFVENESFEGEVDFIYPYLDPKTRAANVRLKFNNPDLLLKPEMHVTVNIISNISDNTLAIPQQAVIRTGLRNIVFVEIDEGHFEPRQVKLGAASDDGFVQVLAGVLEGENVVTSGQFLLDSESQTREAIQKMLASKSEPKSSMKMETRKEVEIQKSKPEKKNKVDAEMKCNGSMDMEENKKSEKIEKKEPEMKCGEGKCSGN